MMHDGMFAKNAVTVDLEQGPRQPCPAGLSVSLHGCIDRWVTASAMRRVESPCRGCKLGQERREAVAYQIPNERAEAAREPCAARRDGLVPAAAERIVRLYTDGASVADIMKTTGHSIGQVKRVVALAVSDPPPDLKAKQDSMVRMWKAGKTLTQVGRAHNVSHVTVRKTLERLGHWHAKSPAGRKPCLADGLERFPTERRQMVLDVIAAYQAGQSLTEVGRHFGLSDVTVYTMLKTMGIARRTPTETKRLKAQRQEFVP